MRQDDLAIILHLLEMHWSNDISFSIRQFVKLDGLPEGLVRTEFTGADSNSAWMSRMLQAVEEIDKIIDSCVKAKMLRDQFSLLEMKIIEIEKIISELLSYLDVKLQRTIQELDVHIEKARSAFVALTGGSL
jgi:hypothetical protein